MSYTIIQVDPRPASFDSMVALLKQNSPVIGIEFTLPALSQYIEINIDGQHIQGGNGKSAIELAMEVKLPAKGTTLAIVRPDADALGAVAVLNIRKEEANSWIDREHAGYEKFVMDEEFMQKRIQLISRFDKFSQGPWEKRSPDLSEDQWVFKGLSVICLNHKLSLEERVSRMEKWLSSEDCPGLDLAIQESQKSLSQAKRDSTIKVIDGISVVESRHIGATELGYQQSPVVVIRNDAFRFQGGETHVKYTICQWPEGYVDLSAIVKVLNELEQCGGTWGGTMAIAGSPQGVSSSLKMDLVVSIVKHHMQ